MEKKQYIRPLVEAEQMTVGGFIMTSVPLPPDPGSSMAPKRVPTLGNDSVTVF